MAEKEEIMKLFPRELRTFLEGVPLDFGQVQELRLRAGRPLLVISGDREYMMTEDGRIAAAQTGERPFVITGKQLKEIVEFMGSFSLYAAEEELRQGFLTVQGGHRIGVAGRTVAQGGEIRLMKSISFLNVRIAHEVKGCADGIIDELYTPEGHFRNTLLVSPPRCGKTTLLRDIIRQVSQGHFSRKMGRQVPGLSVGVVDERSELGACYQGIPQNDLGMRTDVLDCCPKSQGMMMLIRSMSPAVIAVDEIGGREDAAAIEYVRNCGCALAATVHGVSLEEIRRKPEIGRILNEEGFERLIVLDGKKGAGHVSGIFDGKGRTLPADVCRGKEAGG